MAAGDPLTSIPDALDWDALPVPPSVRMSEEEYVQWSLGQEYRTEWVDGEVIVMSPGSDQHENLDGWLIAVLRVLAEVRKLGIVRGNNTSIRFATQRRRRTPDALFVTLSRRDIIRRSYIDGAPDAVFEIISDDSTVRDRQQKFAEYQREGVREYWILDPMHETLDLYLLGADSRYSKAEPREGRFDSSVIDGFYIRPEWMNEDARPTIIETLREWGCV